MRELTLSIRDDETDRHGTDTGQTDGQTDKPYGHNASRLQGCHLDIRAQIKKSR